MKNKRTSVIGILGSAFAVTAILLFCSTPRASAQDDTITVTAAEFQRMVYTAHLKMYLEGKPEIESSLLVLLELHRRNPQANPLDLVNVSQQALQCYWTNAPAYIRTNGYSDEILAAYAEAFLKVPLPPNVAPVTLQLFNNFMLQLQDYWTVPASDLVELLHSGNQRLINTASAYDRRETLIDDCVERGNANSGFRIAMDSFLSDCGVQLNYTPAQIFIINTNLANTPTMQAMYQSSLANGGSVILSTNAIQNLFAQEMQTMQTAISEGLALSRQITQSQGDVPSYLANTNLINQYMQQEQELYQKHAARVAAASASVDNLSRSIFSKLPEIGKAMSSFGKGVHSISDGLKGVGEAWKIASKFGKAATCGNFLAGGLEILGSCLEIAGIFQTEDPNAAVIEQIKQVQAMIGDLSTNMNDRFDQVDKSLTTVLSQLDYSINQLTNIGANVISTRRDLVEVQSDLHRLERNLLVYLTAFYTRTLSQYFNTYLGYEELHGAQSAGQLLTSDDFNKFAEPHFYNQAVANSKDDMSLPSVPSPQFTDRELYDVLTGNRLDQSIKYLMMYLAHAGYLDTRAYTNDCVNPREWFVGSFAWMQLALENPTYFRGLTVGAKMGLLANPGRNLVNFFKSLSFNGSDINWNFYDNLQAKYKANLDSFVNQVHTEEQTLADPAHNEFALGSWRSWATNSVHLTATNTPVLPLPLYAQNVTKVAAGFWHSLGLRADGTVAAWGAGTNNTGFIPAFGQAIIPADLANVKAIAAGCAHNLALLSNGTVRAWGYNADAETSVPEGLNNVQAIAAGYWHNLALRADSTVVGWGLDSYRDLYVLSELTNVVAIAAGGYHSLALRNDGTVIGWGLNDNAQATGVTNGLPGIVMLSGQPLINVCAIAAGFYHSLALLSNGMVVAWGINTNGQTIVPSGASNGVVAIAAGTYHNLALKTDGTLVAWGLNTSGQTLLPTSLGNVVAIAAGNSHNLAVKADGTVVAWGYNEYGKCSPPGSSPGGAIAISSGGQHNIALLRNGTILDWGYGSPTPNLQNVIAISAGPYENNYRHTWNQPGHSLALLADGTVYGWGFNEFGEATGVPTGASSSASGIVTLNGQVLRNVTAIAAGQIHSVVLLNDGTIITWGAGAYSLTNNTPPKGNYVAIAAGWLFSMALTSDGRVFVWGNDTDGVTTTIPSRIQGRTVAISAGLNHCLALLDDGSVAGWGNNDVGQAPYSVSPNYVAIAAGPWHSLALHKDGTVHGWGYNDQGQTTIPAGLSNVVAIAAGGYAEYWSSWDFYGRSVALQADGTVVSWGDGTWSYGTPASLSRCETYPEKKYMITNKVSTQLNGQLCGNPIWVPGVDCLQGYSLSFSGMGDYMTFDRPVSNDFTLECWVKTTQTAGLTNGWWYGMGLIDGECPGWVNDFGLSLGAGRALFGTGGPDAAHTLTLMSDVIADGLWHHMAATRSNGVMRLYTNGSLVAIGTNGNQTLSAPQQMRLGSIATGNNFFNGQLDEVRIWSVPRSEADILANMSQRLQGTESNLVAYWTFDEGPVLPLNQLLTGVKKLAAGFDYTLALHSDGTVVGYGLNDFGQCNVPLALGGVTDIAAGHRHCLALRSDGTVVGWGWNAHGQTDVPGYLGDVLSIAAGWAHSLALKDDGTVIGWGANNAGQAQDSFSPVISNLLQNSSFVPNVVAIAAGAQHSLALKADGKVVAWGAINGGGVPYDLSGVVAIAAGDSHNLALLSDGTVIAWGWNSYGQTNVPTNLNNVVAIAANGDASYALKQDGSVVAWGRNTYGQTDLPAGLGNVVGIAPGWRHSVFLSAQGQSVGTGSGGLSFALRETPTLVTKQWFNQIDSGLLDRLNVVSGPLIDRAKELSGAKALFQSVLELGMPYTMERDDVLHGYFYGTEPLMDLETAKNLLTAETNRLFNTPGVRPLVLGDVVNPRYTCFTNRLHERLLDLKAAGQPETPRLVGHTLRLLNVLSNCVAVTPASLDIMRNTSIVTNTTMRLTVYGEPYAHYILQTCTSFTGKNPVVANMTDLIATNHNEDIIITTNRSGLYRLGRRPIP